MADSKYGRIYTGADVAAVLEHFGAQFEEPDFDLIADQAEREGVKLRFPADEPLFVLRGQDPFVVATIRHYATECNTGRRLHTQGLREAAPKEHVLAASDAATALAEWQREHPDRLKVPD